MGPDGLSDEGDLADISLLHQIGGELAQDTNVANAVDLKHRVRHNVFSFGQTHKMHDMEHAATAIDRVRGSS